MVISDCTVTYPSGRVDPDRYSAGSIDPTACPSRRCNHAYRRVRLPSGSRGRAARGRRARSAAADEPAAFHGQQRILDVVDAQPGVEISQVDQIAGLLDIRKMDLLINIMRAEPAALLAKIFVRGTLRRDWQRK